MRDLPLDVLVAILTYSDTVQLPDPLEIQTSPWIDCTEIRNGIVHYNCFYGQYLGEIIEELKNSTWLDGLSWIWPLRKAHPIKGPTLARIWNSEQIPKNWATITAYWNPEGGMTLPKGDSVLRWPQSRQIEELSGVGEFPISLVMNVTRMHFHMKWEKCSVTYTFQFGDYCLLPIQAMHGNPKLGFSVHYSRECQRWGIGSYGCYAREFSVICFKSSIVESALLQNYGKDVETFPTVMNMILSDPQGAEFISILRELPRWTTEKVMEAMTYRVV